MKRIRWYLYEGETFIESFTSHTKAKKAMSEKIKESIEKSLHTHYSIKKVKEKIEKEEPDWKKQGFKSCEDWYNWYNEMCEDIHHGYI